MRGDWLAAVLGASVLALPAAVATGEERNVLRILWRDHHELFRDFEQARSEADGLFHRLGVEVVWEEDTTPESATREVRIQVVLMPSEPSGWRLPKNAMGVVLLPDRSPQETVYLFYAAILRSLGIANDNGSLLKPRERRDIARAMGRIVVHEIVHALAPSLEHADSGLMHDAFSASVLGHERIKVDERSKRAVLAGLARLEVRRSATGNLRE